MIDFTLDCIPPTASHHSKRIVKVGKFSRLADTDRLIAAKETIDVLLLPHRVPAPLHGPLSLTLEFTWPWRSSDSKRTRALGRIPRDTAPDCDNLAKTFTDRLAVLRFINNDGQVCELIVRKFIGSRPGIRVRLRQVQINPLCQQVSA